MTAELIRICDLAGRPRGTGFVADDCGTVVTSHAAVDGLSRLLLSGTGTSTGTGPGAEERTWLAGASDVTLLPELGLALVRSDGLGVRPLPMALRAAIAPGTYVRLRARGWRQARVLGGAEARYATATGCHALPAALELAIGTDGQDALRPGGEACGGPVLDAGTGAVLAVLATALRTEHRSGGFAVPLAAAAAADPGGPLAALLRRNAATVPGHGADLNLAGVLQLTGTTLGAAFAARGPELVDRPDTAAELDAFATGDRPVLALVGRPGTGRTTALSDLALRRTRGPHPAPTLWLRGADLRTGDTSLADAVARALAEAGRILSVPSPSGAAAPAAPAAPASTASAASPGEGAEAATATAESAAPAASAGAAEASAVAAVAALAGRELLVVLDSPEEMPPRLAHGLGPWTGATAGWLRAAGVRLVLAARPEHWESAGALYPPQMLHLPARPARRLPPALPIGDLTPDEAALARTRLGIPADAVDGADARHPLTLRLLADVRAAGVTTGRPARQEVFAAHLDLLCLRIAVRVCAALPAAGEDTGVYGPGVGRLAARVAGRVHEAARRCLGPGQGQLDRAGFEELFPWRTGWASAVLTEGLLVPAGEGYRFAHEELSDWLQSGHLDLPAALETLDTLGRGVPRHRIGPVLEALLRLPEDEAGVALARLVAVLEGATDPEIRWWAGRLVREILLHAPDATGHLPLLHALAEHVTGPREQEQAADPPREDFGGWFWNRLQLAEADRFELLRRLTARDHRYLDAVARRLVRAPRLVQPLLCGWFADERRLHGRPGATVATAAQALLHTHRQLAVDDLAEALVVAAHPRADELLAVLAEDEPSALCRAVDRWAHDARPGRRVAAAAYGLLTAPHVRTPADRELLRYSAEALLARPDDATLHGSALGILLRDPGARARHLPDALACFRDPERRTRLPAASLVAALPVLPDPDAVFAALRDRADGEVVRALAALTTPGLARRAGDLVREHLARHPQDAAHAAEFVDRRLEQGPAAAPVLRPLVLELLRTGPPGVRAALAAVLAAPGTEASYTLRGELADVLLREEGDPAVLDAFLGALAAGAAVRPQGRTRELLRRTGRRLLSAPGGPAVFELRTVELARAEPAFGALAARWLAEAPAEAAALLGPGARRTVETLGHTASQSTSRQADADDGPRPPAWQS
ncbi:serine protease [Streptomyces sp. NBC_00503]|uniref:serine protease n=1 Tax=Streptomyces sp. NBC_00503 TaxID=2903659 RepID=UPI002E8221CD|nr:serine protease [Streptomyces sp. NBC_00503]WUD83918.1 serine protease [Streptomyces sp. NBC_00503]